MGWGRRVSGTPHRNDWFHDWLVENEITDESTAYKAAKNPGRLADLIDRAETQQSEPIKPISGRSIIAGRSLDLTSYLACGHADCLTKQVDELFSRVWHYFDKIAICGPEAHQFLDAVNDDQHDKEGLARRAAQLARPIFHIRDIGADSLVTWISKPPACHIHWKEFQSLHEYHLPEEVETAVAARLLNEGSVRLVKTGNESRLFLLHRQLFSGGDSRSLGTLQKWRRDGETTESTLARLIVYSHWTATASDLFTARSLGLPLGLGVPLEARMAGLGRDAISPSEVAFNLLLPVVDGLPVKELLALRESESDAFECFRDSLTQAIKERLANADSADDDIDELAKEVQADVIDPALHTIQRRLRAAEGVLRKNHRYNIALAGLSTICGVVLPPDVAIVVAGAALVGATTVESKFVEEKRDIALEDMYFLWKAKEYAQSRSKQPTKRRKKR